MPSAVNMAGLRVITLSEASQKEKDKTMRHHLHVESKRQPTSEHNKNEADSQNKLAGVRRPGKVGGAIQR